jgi:hypothetical protein
VRGKGPKLGEGKGTKLGEPCPKVRLSQDRFPIEPSFFLSQAYFAQTLFTQMLLHANVTQPFEFLFYNIQKYFYSNLRNFATKTKKLQKQELSKSKTVQLQSNSRCSDFPIEFPFLHLKKNSKSTVWPQTKMTAM